MESNLILLTIALITLTAMLTLLIIQKIKNKPLQPIFNSYRSDFKNTHTAKAKTCDQKKYSPEIDFLVENLRKNPSSFASECINYFNKIEGDNFNLRWNLVYSIAELKLPELVPLLSKIALLEVDETTSAKASNISNGEDVTIRMRAIKGLEYIAREGNKPAENAIFELLQNTSATINIAAIESLLEIDQNNMAYIKLKLPKEKQFLLESQQKSRFGNIFNRNEINFVNVDIEKSAVLHFG
jgi:hypothetical protein